MKKRVCGLLLAVLLVIALSACGNQLSGTYYSTDGFNQTFTFSGDKITMSAFGISASGTYEVSGSTITITYDFFGSPQTWTQSFSKDGNSIYIGGTEFRK